MSPQPGKIEGPYDIKAIFVNCAIWGNSKHELIVGDVEGKAKEIIFDHCAVKINEEKYNYDAYFANAVKNQNPCFERGKQKNFRLNAGSPCIDKGLDLPNLPYDIRGNTCINRLLI